MVAAPCLIASSSYKARQYVLEPITDGVIVTKHSQTVLHIMVMGCPNNKLPSMYPEIVGVKTEYNRYWAPSFISMSS